jgi:hypothetical protein
MVPEVHSVCVVGVAAGLADCCRAGAAEQLGRKEGLWEVRTSLLFA